MAWVRFGIIALPHPSMVLDVPYTTTPNPLAPCTNLSLVESLIPLLPAFVHLKAPAVESNHQEEGQSKVLHLGYELIIALQTFRLLHTTINAWTGKRGCRETVDSAGKGVRNL